MTATTTHSPPAAPPAAGAAVPLQHVLREARRAMATARALVTAAALEGLPEDALLAVQRELGGGKHEAELMLAAVCAEIGRRSTPELGAGGLARKQGFADPTAMIAAQTGGSRGDAHTLLNAGKALADAERRERERAAARKAGAPEPPGEPDYPVVARALRAGEISVNAASAITRVLDEVSGEAKAQHIAKAECDLVRKAQGLTLEQLARILRTYRALLRSSDAEVRQRRLERDRYLNVTEKHDGSVEIRGQLDPLSAAPLRTVLDALVKAAFRRRRDGDALSTDTRTPGQIRADSLITMARHMLGCDAAPIAHATTRVVVRVGFEDLRRGAGVAEIDGASAAIPVGDLRRMAVEAEYLPVVLGGASEVLDLGRARREFSRAQREALLERDGGCAMCGAPPSHCEAHHIEWWDRDGGTSDLSNGVMLCVACHHTVHREGWDIEATAVDVRFRPPPSVDPRTRPRLGGRARFGVTAQERAELASMAATTAAGVQPAGDVELEDSVDVGPQDSGNVQS